jgi:hypothetical protein
LVYISVGYTLLDEAQNPIFGNSPNKINSTQEEIKKR